MPVYFRPVTEGDLTVRYTTLDNVKRILRTTSQRRIRFSDSIRNLAPASTNGGTITLSEVNMASDFAGSGRLVEVVFSDSTNFDVTMTAEETRAQYSVGSGSIGVDFTSSGEEFTIPHTAWSGYAVAGDKVSFQTDSHISTDDGLWFIQQAEIAVDGQIGDIGGAYKDIDSTSGRIFTELNVPSIIQSATTYLSAYLIWCVVNAGAVASKEDTDIPTSVSMWRKVAETSVLRWMNREISREAHNVPRYISRMPLFTVEGILGEGRGLLLAEDNPTVKMPIDQDEVDREVLSFGGGEEEIKNG